MTTKIIDYYEPYLKAIKKLKLTPILVKDGNHELYVVSNNELKEKLPPKVWYSFASIPRTIPASLTDMYYIEDVVRFFNYYWKTSEKILEEAYEEEFR